MKTSRRSMLELVVSFVGLGWLVKPSEGKTIGIDPAEGSDQTVIYEAKPTSRIEWISVTERLPAEASGSTSYLIRYHERLIHHVAVRMRIAEFLSDPVWVIGDCRDRVQRCVCFGVTHWAELSTVPSGIVLERAIITTGYITDSKGRKWRLCTPGLTKVTED